MDATCITNVHAVTEGESSYKRSSGFGGVDEG